MKQLIILITLIQAAWSVSQASDAKNKRIVSEIEKTSFSRLINGAKGE